MIIRWILLTVLCLTFAKGNRFETEAVKENLEKGQSKYNEFKDNSRVGKSATCWAGAIEDLEGSCEKLTEETMARLAYSFLTCHLQQHRRKIHKCEDTADIDRHFSCTETLTDTMFGIYTSFVMHTHNMCFYLQSTLWQNKLDNTVDRLQDNSDNVANKLEIQANKQEHLLIGMDAMTDMNTDILSKTEKLQQFIAHIFNLVEKIGYIQQAFYNQFTTYEMILFYTGSIIVTLMTTTFPGVSRARPAMLCMTAICLALEQAIAQYGIIFEGDEVSRYKVQKQLRRVWLVLCIIKWLKTLYSTGRPDNNTQEILTQTRQSTQLLQDIQNKLLPLTAAYKSSMFSDDETATSERTTQTDGELSPVIIKPKKYTKKRSSSPPLPAKVVGSNSMQQASPGRCGTGRYNLRPVTPTRTAPLAPSITWPGFSSDDGDEDYTPRLELSEM